MPRKRENIEHTTDFHRRLESLLGDNIPEQAQKIGVHETTVRVTWLQNESYPTADNLIKICEVTKVSADWLLFGKENPAESPQENPHAKLYTEKEVVKMLDIKDGLINTMDRQIKMLESQVSTLEKQIMASKRKNDPASIDVSSMRALPGKK
jgi:transcriptional regulator with XRE-family HTH domain